MEDDSSPKITMFFYILKEGDVKEPLNKYNIIPKKSYIIGRSSKECDIVLDEKLLSRKHAELIYNNKNEIIIRDFNSRNGTYINKERIEPDKDILFSINDTLSLGNMNNEIVFNDYTEVKKEEEFQKEQEKENDKENYFKQNNNDNNYQENNNYQNSEKNKSFDKNNSKSKNSKKSIINIDHNSYKSNNKSYSRKNISRQNSRSRSRSKETERKNSKNFAGLENIIKNLDERNKDDNKYYERNSRDEYYRSRHSYGRERERERDRYSMRHNNRYEYDDYNRNRMNNNDTFEFENNFGNNREDIGYIKCYVSGYMYLKIKK